MLRCLFNKIFRIVTVKLVTEEGFSVNKVSILLEAHVNGLYRWF